MKLTVGQSRDRRPTVDSRGRHLPKSFSELRTYFLTFFSPTKEEESNLDLAFQSAETATEEKTFETVSVLTGALEERVLRIDVLERRSMIDPKTQLSNWDGYKQRAISCIIQEGQSTYVTFVVLDLVAFGFIDNTYGLDQGDAVLKVAALALSEVVRDRREYLKNRVVPQLGFDHGSQRSVELLDMVARFGGDEFLYLLLETEPQGSKVALRAKEKLRSIDWYSGPEVQEVELEEGTRQYLKANPLDMRAGVVHLPLPNKHQRPDRIEAGRIVDKAFKRADALMKEHKKDPENPVHSVVCYWQSGNLKDLTPVTRTVL